MRQAIVTSSACIVFLSAGVMSKAFCQLEIRQALAAKKTIILIRTSDQSVARFFGQLTQNLKSCLTQNLKSCQTNRTLDSELTTSTPSSSRRLST